ncbi:MAG: LacI family transcriptional regulator [Acidimicrobiia bacterium]|nr:LacI family transcriptional regulator [Acidimicrobiia bacterium]
MTDRITLREVAEAAGVHMSTASRALNEETREVVNAETVARVLKAAKKLGYTPNPLARGLRTNRTLTVGMVIPDIENPLFGPIIGGAEARLGADGYSLLIADADLRNPSSAANVIETLIERRVDGLILATSARKDPTMADLSERNIAAVLVNRSADASPLPSIVGDDHAGIGLAVEHLVEMGHTRIGHVAGPRSISTGHGRRQAFLSWMQTVGINADPDDIEEAEWYRVDAGLAAAAALLDRKPDITAIVCANDLLAMGAYRAVRQRGLTVGPDVAITGYNDIPLLDLLEPPLTSVRVPYRQMGSEAAALLLSILSSDNGQDRPVSMRLAPTLSVRGSSGPHS